MPFDSSFDAIFELLIKPPLEEAGFVVTRADLSNNQTQILRDVVTMLARADLVVADVTDLNGNVMYELGLAHAMGKRTVMLTQSIAQLPFDLHSYRANEYSTHFSEAAKLKDRLRDIAVGVIDHTLSFGNPVQDFAPEYVARGASDRTFLAPEQRDDASDGEEDDRGFLDFALDLTEASEEVQEHTAAIVLATTLIGDKVAERGTQIRTTSKNLGGKAAPVLRQIMRDTAGEFDDFAESVEESNGFLESAIRRFGDSTNGLARVRPADSPEAEQQIRDEIDALDKGVAHLAGASASTTTFAQSMLELPPMEQSLNRASKRAAQAVTTTASLIDLTGSEFVRARGLLEERLRSIESSV
jgi:hypothetical protein